MEKSELPEHDEVATSERSDNAPPDEVVAPRDSFDSVTKEAIGGKSTQDLPPNYYRSPQYIASFIVSGPTIMTIWPSSPLIIQQVNGIRLSGCFPWIRHGSKCPDHHQQ